MERAIEELHAASRDLPEGWHLRVKEHPTSRESFADMLHQMADEKFCVDNTADTFEQVSHSKGVITVNSSVGLQAFLFDKPVIVLGEAFYGIPELTYQASNLVMLKQLLADPSALQVRQADRDAYMTYLDEEYYPLEIDVIEGRFGPDDVLRRPHHIEVCSS